MPRLSRPRLGVEPLEDRCTPTTTQLLSQAPGGVAANNSSLESVVSRDGRFVAFTTYATNLNPGGDPASFTDVYLADRVAGGITLVSHTPSGSAGDFSSFSPSISADGRFVVFLSNSTNLVPGHPFQTDGYLFDRLTGAVTLIGNSVPPPTFGAGAAVISADGRYVASVGGPATVPPALAGRRSSDVYVTDRVTGTTTLVSALPGSNDPQTSFRGPPSRVSDSPSISADGQFVTFTSRISDPNIATNDPTDVYGFDLSTGTITLLSTGIPTASGTVRSSSKPTVSADGRIVAFLSSETTGSKFSGITAVSTGLFIYDRATGVLSQPPLFPGSGDPNQGSPSDLAINADGRYIAFRAGPTLFPTQGPSGGAGFSDIYRFDRLTGVVSLASQSPAGNPANGESFGPTISADGQVVAFFSTASDLVPGDTNGVYDVFTRDFNPGPTPGGGSSGPVGSPLNLVAAGAGPGGQSIVRVYNPDGTQRLSLFGIDPAFQGGVSVATADLTGDLIDDVVVGAGAGGGPVVRVFDGNTGDLLATFFAFDPSFRGGITVAAADLDGDGIAEIIVGTGVGGGPVVRVFDRAGNMLSSFLALDASFRGGITVAGLPGRIVVGAGAGGGPAVLVFDLAGNLVNSFFAFDPAARNGVNVTADAGVIAAVPGSGGGPVVATFGPDGTPLGSFFGFDPGLRAGASVGSRGGSDPRLYVGTGPGVSPAVREYDLSGNLLSEILPFDPAFLGGVSVG